MKYCPPTRDEGADPVSVNVSLFSQNTTMEHWHKDAQDAALLAGAMRNREDHA